MKHYINSEGVLFAFEDDGSQDFLITADMRLATDEEVAAIQNPQASYAQLLESALAEIRAQRAPILDALAGIAGRADRSGDTATAQAADMAAQALLDITVLPAFLAAQTYDDMKAAIMSRYGEISAAAPSSVQTVFREVMGG